MAPGGAYMALGRVWGSLAGALAAAEVIRLVRWASLGKHACSPVALSVSGQPRQAHAFNHSRCPRGLRPLLPGEPRGAKALLRR